MPNWILGTAPAGLPSTCTFVLYSPVVTSHPPNRTVCAGNSTTFSITAPAATSYQWYLNTGVGFQALSNSGHYSDVTTNKLTITGATTDINGYQYRCVATNGAGSATSSPATLTVISIGTSGTQTDVSCFNGSNGQAKVTPSGGINPYTYSWFPSGGTGATASGLAPGNYTVTVTDNVGCQATKNYTITAPAAPLSGTATVTHTTCFTASNGAIDLTPSGGTPPYTYNWGGGVTTEDRTGLAAGAYSVIITDNNSCTVTVNAIVTRPGPLSGTATVTNVSCFGGSNGAIDLAPGGGTPPYTYNWGGGVTTQDRTNLAPGAYAVLITDANGCTNTVNAIVTQPGPLSGTATVTNVSCFGGTNGAIDLTPASGTPPYTYNWGGGITTQDRTALALGAYSVVITDAKGCTNTVNAIVTQPGPLSGTATVTNVSCFGGNNGAINLTPAGGTSPYTFNWGDGATTQDRTGLATGTYSVTITDANGCTNTVNATVTQPAAAVSGTTVATNVSCFGGNNGAIDLTPSGGTPSYTYSWGDGVTTQNRTALAAGAYSVTITDANGCTNTVNAIVTQPGPLSGTATVTDVSCFEGNNGAINLTPAGGTSPYTFDWGGSVTAEDRTGLAAGAYSVTITDANGCTNTVNATVTQPAAAVSGTTVVTHVGCFGEATGAIDLTPAGGTAPYTYSWGDGATTQDRTGLAAGTYSVTITDANSCTNIVNATVTQPAAAVSGTVVVTNVSCFGGNNGAINLTPAGGTSPYTFDWGGGVTTEDRTGLAAGAYSVTITDANGCSNIVNATVTQPAAAVSGTTIVTDVTCFGGSNGAIDLTPAGGTSPYTFDWGDGITTEDRTDLAAGAYSVTITDANSCSNIVNATVTQPAAAVSGATIVTDVTCFGGSNGAIDLTPAGGTSPYTFDWGDGITTEDRTDLAAGAYSVTITDANSCSNIVNATVTQPAAAVSGATIVTDVTCFGGSNGAIDLTPAGGTSPYTFDWGDGITTEDRTDLAAGAYSVTITDANSCTITVNATVTQPTALTTTVAAQADVSCHGGSDGSATVAASGGTGSYTYSWYPSGGTGTSASGLAAGSYTITVTDANGCEATQNVTISAPAAPLAAVAASQENVSCNGGASGSATVSVSGGTPGYTYSWSPSGGADAIATGLSAGSYTVTVTDANGCITTSTFNITQPSAISVTTSQTNPLCNGDNSGTATVTALGGIAPYTYSWSPSGGMAATATGLAAGNYSVTVTDANSCTLIQGFTITEPPALDATAGVQTNVTCNGDATGSATVAVTGGTPGYTYAWNTIPVQTTATATGLAAGTYTVTVTDANDCTDTQNFTITQPAAVNATAGTQTNVACNGASTGSATVAVTGGTPGYTYSWNTIPAQTTATATALAAGTYIVTVTDANGCTDTQSFTITQPAALTATTSQTNVSCNGGADGTATVTAAGGTSGYTYSWNTTPVQSTATATGLQAGTYTVTVTDANGCTNTQSVTITQPAALSLTLTSTSTSCPGYNDGTATVTASGGVAPYAYSWNTTPVQTTTTATALVAGSYTVQVTDANGCTATQAITVNTTPDVTPAVPDVANLPTITRYCQVLHEDIPAPTATDNCNGRITATTTDPLDYTAPGTYSITWTYNDGNGNTSSQTQTIVVEASPLNQVTFNNAVFTYNGSVQSIAVSHLPAGAAAAYSIAPATGSGNGAINAGTYTVTATLTPPAAAPGCGPVTLTATITVNKAPQIITFDEIPVRNLETDPDFQLGATASSGLDVYYTYSFSAAQPPATITAGGFADMLTSGQVLVTAHQDGNENWLPAVSVEQAMTIESSNAAISAITVGNKAYANPSREIYYLMGCNDNTDAIDITITTEANADVSLSHEFTIQTPAPGIYTRDVTVVSQDGSATQTYTVVIERHMDLFSIASKQFGSVLIVNNNPQTNGGYRFIAYEWYRNGVLVGTGQYYAGDNNATGPLTAEYYLKLTTADGDVLQTCIAPITLESTNAARLYPNPARAGGSITIEVDFPVEELAQMQIDIYSLTGKLITTQRSTTPVTQVQLPGAMAGATYIVAIKTPNIRKTLKVIVRK
ncbi:T9SS type A sorting domain-containing protein [Chitinophaga alhagiae]|uniref:T9SS type A sorting domain-containing protein n=1 Tax=Chitinophaga alhagiae TaxID=2203219 RepID=UPI0021D07BB1|nr:T9SS type A sorting domain-containing protein [Chitinophaga alhagiae]